MLLETARENNDAPNVAILILQNTVKWLDQDIQASGYCSSNHSAAYGGCPKRRDGQQAIKISILQNMRIKTVRQMIK